LPDVVPAVQLGLPELGIQVGVGVGLREVVVLVGLRCRPDLPDLETEGVEWSAESRNLASKLMTPQCRIESALARISGPPSVTRYSAARSGEPSTEAFHPPNSTSPWVSLPPSCARTAAGSSATRRTVSRSRFTVLIVLLRYGIRALPHPGVVWEGRSDP
jgi:hypothetical protein